MKKIDSFRFNVAIRYFLLIAGLSIALLFPVFYTLSEDSNGDTFGVVIMTLFGLSIFNLSRSRIDVYSDHFDFIHFGFHNKLSFKEVENCTISHQNLILFKLINGKSRRINNSYENFDKILKFVEDHFTVSNKRTTEEKKKLLSQIEKFTQTYLPNGLLTIKADRKFVIKEVIISILFILFFAIASIVVIEYHPPKAPKYGILIITIPACLYFIYRIFNFLRFKVQFDNNGVSIKGHFNTKSYDYEQLVNPRFFFLLPQLFSLEDQKIITEFTQLFVREFPIQQPTINSTKERKTDQIHLNYSNNFKRFVKLGFSGLIVLPILFSIIGAILGNYEQCIIAALIAVAVALFFYFTNNLSLTQTLYHDCIELSRKGKVTKYQYTEFRYLKQTQLHGKFFLTFKDLKQQDIPLPNMTDDALQFLKQVLPFVNDAQNSIAEMEESKTLCVKNSQTFSSTEELTKVSQKWINFSLAYLFIGGLLLPSVSSALLQKFGINGLLSVKLIYASTILFDTLLLFKAWQYKDIYEYPKLANMAIFLPSAIVMRVITLISVSADFHFSHLHITVITGLLSVLFYFIFHRQFRYIHKKRQRVIYSYITIPLFVLSTVIATNFFLDFSTPKKIDVIVLRSETETSDKGHDKHYLIFQEIETKEEFRLKASCREYRYAEIGEEAVLYQKPGALGIPWVYDFKILSFD